MADHAYTTPPSAADVRSRAERYLQRHLDRAGDLIALLDANDGDADLESTGDDEPSLSAIGKCCVDCFGDDQELDESDEELSLGWSERASVSGCLGSGTDETEPDGDDERSLGWTEATSVRWRAPGINMEEDEPSLGSVHAVDQRLWTGTMSRHLTFHQTKDLEEACEDEGAQCEGEGDMLQQGVWE